MRDSGQETTARSLSDMTTNGHPMKPCKHEFKKLTFKSSLGEDFVECECGRKFYPNDMPGWKASTPNGWDSIEAIK